jgi:hypothetical protein
VGNDGPLVTIVPRNADIDYGQIVEVPVVDPLIPHGYHANVIIVRRVFGRHDEMRQTRLDRCGRYYRVLSHVHRNIRDDLKVVRRGQGREQIVKSAAASCNIITTTTTIVVVHASIVPGDVKTIVRRQSPHDDL